jgi:hypothetical protein
MNRDPRIVEMTIEGDFVDPPRGPRVPFGTRVMVWAAAFAAVAIAGVVAVFALWVLAVLVPIAVIAAAIAYAVFRYQVWRNGGQPPNVMIWRMRR